MKATKQCVGILSLIALVVSGGVYAGDSTGLANTLPAHKGADGITSMYPDQITVPYKSGKGTDDIQFNAGDSVTYFDILPSCPLDPSSSTQKSRNPICPDINGYWTESIPGTSISPGKKPSEGDNILQLYCPDICKTTRSVITNSYTSGGQTIQQITSYTPAVCPNGYVQVAATNPQPTVIDPSQAGVATAETDYVQSKSELDRYINQGMQCYGVHKTPTDMDFTYYCSDNVEGHPNVCFANTGYSNITKSSTGLGTYTSAVDNSTYYGVTIACDSDATYYYTSPGVCKNKVAGQTVSGLTDSSYRAEYANTFVKIKCKPTGLYLSTTSQEPSTLVCARVKSVWQKRY